MTENNQKRPLTASKLFSVSPFSTDTFKPFSIGTGRNARSPTHNQTVSPTNTNYTSGGQGLESGVEASSTKHGESRSPSRVFHDHRGTPKPPLKIPQRPNTAASHVSRHSLPTVRADHGESSHDSKQEEGTTSYLDRKKSVKVAKNEESKQTAKHPISSKDVSSLNDRIKVHSKDTADSIWETYHRHKVPHDYHLNRYTHSHYCRDMLTGHPGALPHTSLTKNIAFSPRHTRTTFGKSNRIDFLRNMFLERGVGSMLPTYPASYHGTGGEGKEYALGLTVAGTAGDSRILRPCYSYNGMKDIPNRKYPETKLPDIHSSDAKSVRQISRQPDPAAPKHIREILHLDGGQWKQFHLNHAQPTVSKVPHTRYESNKEWTRHTGTLIQSPSTVRHFYISEQERFAHVPYVDEEAPKRRRDYETKIKRFIRDKNVNTIQDLLSPTQV